MYGIPCHSKVLNLTYLNFTVYSSGIGVDWHNVDEVGVRRNIFVCLHQMLTSRDFVIPPAYKMPHIELLIKFIVLTDIQKLFARYRFKCSLALMI